MPELTAARVQMKSSLDSADMACRYMKLCFKVLLSPHSLQDLKIEIEKNEMKWEFYITDYDESLVSL